MNEITRIHIAKTAYDIEIAAKKQLEKYIKSLESYTQDGEVLGDIEIRMTELLAERGVKAGGVIGSDDVAALRAQLGEPHEFAEEDGDIAVGVQKDISTRRLYRSTDTAVLGGVLSGIATYFNVNPLWTRLVFVLLLFISFGFASLVYVLFWVIVPPARTATEKLQLAGKDVTVESIKALNADDEVSANKTAPILQRILFVSLGIVSLLTAIGVAVFTIWLALAALTFDARFLDLTNGFMGLGEGNAWIAWSLFGVVLFGLGLLAALFGLIAYAFLVKKLTKRIVVSGVIIMALGIVSVATVVGVSGTQSFRVANETRSMVTETKTTLPADFKNITSLKISQKTVATKNANELYFSNSVAIRYIVDDGPARYEWSALPTSKAIVSSDGERGEIKIEIPSSYRNTFVQPVLTVYGPALSSISTDVDAASTQVSYDGQKQNELTINAQDSAWGITITGTFETVTVKGHGTVHLGSSTVRNLVVQSEQDLSVMVGTVNTLTVTQPTVCPIGTYGGRTAVYVEGVASGEITYNGEKKPAKSIKTSCAAVMIEKDSFEEAY